MKILPFAISFAVVAFLQPCNAEDFQKKFVRKPLPAPEFFVPKEDVQYQEKLPPFYFPKPSQPEKPQENSLPQENIQFQPVPNQTDEPQQNMEFNPNINVDFNKPQSQSDETPKYKQEYDAYLKDLEVIAQTGVAPKNYELQNDLAAFSDDKRFTLNDDGQIPPQRPLNPMASARILPDNTSEKTNAVVVDAIEVVNIPKSLQKTGQTDAQKSLDNPFANAKTVQTPQVSPEVAAHFRGGNNPFAPQTNEEPTFYAVSSSENSAQKSTSENINDNAVSDTSETFTPQPLIIQEDKGPKVSRNMGRRTKRSSSSSGNTSHSSSASFNLGPNMVR